MISQAGVYSEAATARSLARERFLLCALAIALLSCVLNLGGISRSEVIDDHDLLHNPTARGCGRNPIDCFRNPLFGLYYRPLVGVSFSLGENLHGQSPFPFHVENLILHAAVILEACWAFRLLLRRERAALFAGLLYGLHPLQVPVTTFIGGRTDSLALLFLFWFIIGAAKGSGGRFAPAWKMVSVIGFAGAIFTKEQCMLLVLLAPLISMVSRPEGMQQGVRRKLPPLWMLLYAVPSAALLAGAHRVIPPGAIDTVAWSGSSARVGWDLALRIEMVGRTAWYYAKCFLWPTLRTLHQSTLGAWDLPQPLTTLAGFFAVGMWIAILRHTWTDRRMRVMTMWVVLTLIPCLNVIPIPSQFIACYRAAIPLFGFAGLAGELCDSVMLRYARRSRAYILGALAVLAAVLAGLSVADVPMWRSDAAITMAQFRADPNFLPALAGYATAQRSQGQLREAIATNDRVMDRIFPAQRTFEEQKAVIGTPWMLRNLKSQSSLRYQPRAFVGYVMRERGGALQTLGLYLRAAEDYRLALAVQPDDTAVGDALAVCYELSGRYEDARAVLKKLIAIAPSSARYHRLGSIDIHLDRWIEARQSLAHALSHAVRERSANASVILRLYEKTEQPALEERERTGKR